MMAAACRVSLRVILLLFLSSESSSSTPSLGVVNHRFPLVWLGASRGVNVHKKPSEAGLAFFGHVGTYVPCRRGHVPCRGPCTVYTDTPLQIPT